MNVRDLMRSPIVIARPNTSVGKVAAMMLNTGLIAIPVVDANDELVGMVTQADLIVKHAHVHGPTYLGILGGIIPFETRRQDEEMRRALGVTAAEIMSTKISTIGPDDDVDDAATVMVETGQRAVIVVADGAPVGLVSESDIVRLLVAEEGNDDGAASA